MIDLLLLLLLALQQPSAFRAEVRIVRVDVEVRRQAASIEGLTKQDFRVRDEGKPQEVLYFGQAEEPLDLILLFDTSGSMLPAIEQVATVSRIALGAMRQDDRVAVMAFDAARHFLKQPRSNRRRAVLIVTDNMGSSRDERAARECWQADAVVSAVVVPGLAAMRRQRMLFPGVWFGFGSIDGTVRNTGGDVLKGDDEGDGFRRLIQRLRSRYTLHYAMPDGKPGKARGIKVELTRDAARRFPDARVFARTGYVVPGR